MKLPEKTLDGQNLGEAYDSYLKGNFFKGYCQLVLGAECQFGCGILKMVGHKMQAFCPRINMLKEFFFETILR